MNLSKNLQIEDELKNHNYIIAAERAKNWIIKNTIRSEGIVITSKQRTIYQEVSGYYIPTLLKWGMRDLAITYAKYLCSVQQKSGAWMSYDLRCESVFNTGQVLRGLVSIIDIMPEAKQNLYRGCEWLLSNVDSDGRLVPTPHTQWPKSNINTELIHVYCLPPLMQAGKLLQQRNYYEAVKKILNYYSKTYHEDIIHFNYLSHFYAYVIEAMLDMGERAVVDESMKTLENIQRDDGAIPAYQSCHWVCTTGLFQIALIWYKMGNKIRGDKAFDYAVSMQNPSGGWYGGKTYGKYHEKVDYFPDEEISWAVKYFFDALYWRQKLEFEQKMPTFLTNIDSSDEKYQAVYREVQKCHDGARILDVGCGKGRYLKKLRLEFPQHKFYGMDISSRVMEYIDDKSIALKITSMQCMDFPDDLFDVVYAAESLEHAILIKEAIREMVRVLKEGGVLVIIDKDEKKFDEMKNESWIIPSECRTKRWLNREETIRFMEESGLVNVASEWLMESGKKFFRCFIGEKRALE